MTWAYVDTFKTAKQVLAEKEKKKKEDEEKRVSKINDGVGHPNNQYMTKKKFNKYNLNKPPGLVSQIWIESPYIVLPMMIHYIITEQEVPIPYH